MTLANNHADDSGGGVYAEGNVHVNVLGAGDHAGRFTEAVLQQAIDLGGTISAEHGIGQLKDSAAPDAGGTKS